jgi:hypothetical protein
MGASTTTTINVSRFPGFAENETERLVQVRSRSLRGTQFVISFRDPGPSPRITVARFPST